MAGDFGLGAVLSMDTRRFSASTARAGTSLGSLTTTVSRVNTGLGKLQSGLMATAGATAAISAALGLTVKTAGNFEQAIQNVKAVSPVLRENENLFAALRDRAKELGSTTSFSASQAADAMQNLARAGLHPKEMLKAIGPLLDTAAAEGMELSVAADIVASNLKAFGLEASSAGRVADVLALASSKTNTTITGLQEGMKFAAPTARILGVSLEETAAALGILANVGLKGTLAGTSLKNMMLRLAKPTSKALELFGGRDAFNEAVVDAGGNLRSLEDIMGSIGDRMNKFGTVTEKAAFMEELFGKRGMGATAAMISAADAAAKGGLNVSGLTEALKDSAGAAKTMADTRLDTFQGALIILKSAAEGLGIELGGLALGGLRDFVEGVTRGASGVGLALKAFATLAVGAGSSAEALTEARKALGKISPLARDVAEAILSVRDVVRSAFDNYILPAFRTVRGYLAGMSSDLRQTVLRGVMTFGVFAAALLPVLSGLAAVGFVVMGVGSALSGLGTIAAAVFSVGFLVFAVKAVAVVGLLALALNAARRDGEGFGDTVGRLWGTLTTAVGSFLGGFVGGFQVAWTEIAASFAPVVATIQELFATIFSAWSGGTETSKTDWVAVGQTVAFVMAGVLTSIGSVLSFVATIYSGFLRPILSFVFGSLGDIASVFTSITAATATWQGALRTVGNLILRAILFPLQLATGLVGAMAEAVGLISGEQRQKLEALFSVDSPKQQSAPGLVSRAVVPPAPAPTVALVGGPEKTLTPESGPGTLVGPAAVAAVGTQNRRLGVGGLSGPSAQEIGDAVRGAIPESINANITSVLQLDGTEVARVVGRQEIEFGDRTGVRLEPGVRSSLAAHGFRPSGT